MVNLPAEDLSRVPTPALVLGEVRHQRHVGVRDSFAVKSLQWLVDVDTIPSWQLGRHRYTVDQADHLSGNGFRADVAALLTDHGLALTCADRVLMLTHPQIDGTVFDPLTVFWCLRPDGTALAAILEVHNTYGGRHSYVLGGPGTRHTVRKQFYVSPFNDVSGEYRVRLSLDSRAVHVTVNLHRAGELVLAASVGGPLTPLTPATLRAGLRRVRWAKRRVSVLIRWRGVLLFLRRLPRHPRPAGHTQPQPQPHTPTQVQSQAHTQGVTSGTSRSAG